MLMKKLIFCFILITRVTAAPNPDVNVNVNIGINDGSCKGIFCKLIPAQFGVDDYANACPEDTQKSKISLRNFISVNLDPPPPGQPNPVWDIRADGSQVTQNKNCNPGLMYGPDDVSGGDFEGKLYFDKSSNDDDYAGFVFGYENPENFYVVMWKRADQNYGSGPSGPNNPRALAGAQLKRVKSINGPGLGLNKALWYTGTTPGEVIKIWNDPYQAPWKYDTVYRWQLIWRPLIGTIRFRILESNTEKVIVASPNLYHADTIKKGKLGIFDQSQADVTWSCLTYNSNDVSVPLEMYNDLPPAKQAMVAIDHTMNWSGVSSPIHYTPLVAVTEPDI